MKLIMMKGTYGHKLPFQGAICWCGICPGAMLRVDIT